jgi:hypothetical protein
MSVVQREDVAIDIEKAVIGGDLAPLKPEQRLAYYKAVCDSVGLNPLTMISRTPPHARLESQ